MGVGEVAEQFGASRRTGYKWLACFRAGGEATLENLSFRPRRSPRRLPVEEVAAGIAALRRRRMSGPRIALTLSLPISSVSLELKRLGLNRLPHLEARPRVVRYEYEASGDMIHLDIKKLGKIDGIGHRITGDRLRRQCGMGWEYLHVCVDDHGRVAYNEVLQGERAASATGFLLRAVNWLGRHGGQGAKDDDRPRLMLLLPLIQGCCQSHRSQTGLHQALYSPHQWKGRALHPDQHQGLSLRKGLSGI